jgi:hypothetical protein
MAFFSKKLLEMAENCLEVQSEWPIWDCPFGNLNRLSTIHVIHVTYIYIHIISHICFQSSKTFLRNSRMWPFCFQVCFAVSKYCWMKLQRLRRGICRNGRSCDFGRQIKETHFKSVILVNHFEKHRVVSFFIDFSLMAFWSWTWKTRWVCLKIGYIPNYSHLIGIMIINHWV